MKYIRLTKEQLHALQKEFANFLASQSIDKAEWDDIKTNRPHIAEQEIDVFSDLIWEGVLSRARYLEHISPTHIFLFAADNDAIRSIVIKSLIKDVDLSTADGWRWLDENLFGDKVELKIGRKPLGSDRNADLFGLIGQGAVVTNGKFFQKIDAILAAG